MRQLLIAGILVVTSAAAANAQAPRLEISAEPVTLTFLNKAQVGEVLSTIARLGRITIEFDATVSEEARRAPLASELRMNNATLEEVLAVITSQNGLTYTVSGPKAIRISKKQD
jgi:hypothetical protein